MSEPLSIIHVLSSFGMGGLERVALDLAGGQQRAGHEVLTVALASGAGAPLAREFRDAGLAIESIPVKAKGFDFAMPFRLGRLFRQRRVDVVHTHNPQPLVMGAAAARLAGAAVVHSKHGVNPTTPRRMAMRRAAARLVHYFVAVSESTAVTAREQRECPPDRLRVIANGIDTDRFEPSESERARIRAELGIADDVFFGLTVGRLWPEKGHPYLIDSLLPLLREGAVLAIAGDGPERDNLAHLVADLDLEERVLLLGNRSDVPSLVAAADVFFLSSVREGLPLVIPEAMAGGLPVISTAVGGIPKVVLEGETGFLVESGDREAMRARARELAGDAALRRRMGEAGRQRSLAEYSCARMIDDYAALYRRAMGSKA